MMKKRIFAAAMALCLMAGTGVFAQSQNQQRMRREMPTVEQMAQRKTDRMKEKLNLTEEQTKQVYDYNLQEIKQMQSMRQQMRAARQAEAEKMKAILTPAQYEQWIEAKGPQCSPRGREARKGRGQKGACCDKPCMKDNQ